MSRDKDPFEIAKSALRMVGKFATPPTPHIYEVWYRYFVGDVPAIEQQLGHAMHTVGRVDVPLLEHLHQQFCQDDQAVSPDIGLSFSKEIENVTRYAGDYKTLGNSFGQSLRSIERDLDQASDRNRVRECVDLLTATNEDMRKQLDTLGSQLTHAANRMQSLQSRIDESNEKLMKDPLTGLGNRRYFDWLIGDVQASQAESTFLMILDIDHLEQANEAFGFEAGDRLIQFVASEITKAYPELRWARLGSDEIACLCEDRKRDEVLEIAEELRNRFASNRYTLVPNQSHPLTITVSIGAARWIAGETAEDLEKRTQQMVAQAKSLGRDRAIVQR
ncbi:MAG: GGDEF domain-containing protein [Planctomycetota bacterium]